MIKNDSEYKKAVKRLRDEQARLKETKMQLEEKGFSGEEIKNLTDPLLSFHLQLKEEVDSYEKLKRGEFDEITNFAGLGHVLVCLRIASGMTQSQFANKLGVSQAQVSRDERNEYHAVSVERLARIIKVLDVTFKTRIEAPYLEAA